jgi:hypothetical protein
MAWCAVADSEFTDQPDDIMIEQLAALFAAVDPVPLGVEQNAVELLDTWEVRQSRSRLCGRLSDQRRAEPVKAGLG